MTDEPLSYLKIDQKNVMMETLSEHSYKVARTIYSDFLQRGFHRIILRKIFYLHTLPIRNPDHAEKVVHDSLILMGILHDAGKAHVEYQNKIKEILDKRRDNSARFSGHEAYSARIAFQAISKFIGSVSKGFEEYILKDFLGKILTIAIVNHHHTMMRRQKKVYENALKPVNEDSEVSGSFKDWPNVFIRVIKSLEECMHFPENASEAIRGLRSSDINKSISIVRDIINGSLRPEYYDISNIALYPLMVSDNVVAMSSRNSKDSSTRKIWAKSMAILNVRRSYKHIIEGVLNND